MSIDKFFKNYKRKLIQLDRNVAILIHIFEKDSDHSFEDFWLHDLTGVYETDLELLRGSAKQLIDQLEGNWCRAFLEALRDECDARIEQDLIDCDLKNKESDEVNS